MVQGVNLTSSSGAGSSLVSTGTQSSAHGRNTADIRKQLSALNSQFPNLSVSISPTFLAKMASQPDAAAKGQELLDGIPAAQQWLQNTVRANGSELVSNGMMIDAEGNMSSWSITRTSSGPDKAASDDSDKDKTQQKKHVGAKADSAQKATENLVALIEKEQTAATSRARSNLVDISA